MGDDAVEIQDKDDSKECSFHQIRRSFEEKTKSSSSLTQANASDTKIISDFQKLYPIFKSCFTKRQFSAMENAFNKADRNQDGFLEPKEVKTLLVDHQQPVNLCDAESIVGLGDKNKDGKLCPKEFLEMCMPAAESIRDEHFKQGNSFCSDQEFVQEVLHKVRSLVNPVNKNVRGARLHFENIISGGINNEKEKTSSPKESVTNRYLKSLEDK